MYRGKAPALELWDTSTGWILLDNWDSKWDEGTGRVTNKLIDALRVKFHPLRILRHACVFTSTVRVLPGEAKAINDTLRNTNRRTETQ